jgi:hypothetical protein
MKQKKTLNSLQKFKIKIKKSKTYTVVVDVLSQTYPMVSLSYRSKLYRRHTGRRRKRDNLLTGEGEG